MPKLDATPSHMLERGALGHCLTTLSYPRTRATARCSQRPCQPLPLPLLPQVKPQAMARSARARSAHAIDAGRGARRRRWRPPEAARDLRLQAALRRRLGAGQR